MILNEKAIAVCQDVIKHLDSLQLETSIYCSGDLPDLKPEQSLQERVEEATQKCRVCLLGACMLSKARVYNALTMKQAGYYWSDWTREGTLSANSAEVRQALEDIFDPATMIYMESAFELDDMSTYGAKYDYALVWGAIVFGYQYDDLAERVQAVMEATITQGGIFRPQPATEEEVDELRGDLSDYDGDYDDDCEDEEIDEELEV